MTITVEQARIIGALILLLAFIGYRVFSHGYKLGFYSGKAHQDNKNIYTIFALKRELSTVFTKEDLKLVDYFVGRFMGGIDAKESIEKALEKERIIKGFDSKEVL